VQTFQDEYRLSFPIVLDLDQSVYQTYQTMGVPESLLIDRDGRIVERYVGPREWDAPEYVERIRQLIQGNPLAGS
jgi:peroxiredoxin